MSGFNVAIWERQCEKATSLSRPATQVMMQDAEAHTREVCTRALKQGGEQYREWLTDTDANRVGQVHARIKEKPCELEHPARYSDPPTYIAAKQHHWAAI